MTLNAQLQTQMIWNLISTGTTKIKNLANNIGSVKVTLTQGDLCEISDAVPADKVAGLRNHEELFLHSWKFANTPLRNGGAGAE